jgi:hypothetical protein
MSIRQCEVHWMQASGFSGAFFLWTASGSKSGLPDFYPRNIPKREIYTKMTTKYTKWPYNIRNGCKMDQMAINLPTYFIARHSKIYPNWDFWFESIPSGNPAQNLDPTLTFLLINLNAVFRVQKRSFLKFHHPSACLSDGW